MKNTIIETISSTYGETILKTVSKENSSSKKKIPAFFLSTILIFTIAFISLLSKNKKPQNKSISALNALYGNIALKKVLTSKE